MCVDLICVDDGFVMILFVCFGVCVCVQVDVGLKDDLVFGDPDAPRFVFWNGKLRPVPAKPADFPFFDLMSLGGKLRAGFGALGIRPPPPVFLYFFLIWPIYIVFISVPVV